MNINMNKKIGFILVIFHSFISCKSENEAKTPPPPRNMNEPNSTDSNELITSTENFINTATTIASETSHPTAPVNQLKFNFTDSSETAVKKLEAMISAGKFSDIFGKPFEDLFSNVMISRSVESSNIYFSQQSNYQSNRVYQKEAISDSFFYASNPEQHTSQNCYIVKMKPSVDKRIFEKLHDVFGMIEAKVYKKYKHGFLGYSICFPENTLPLALMREIPSIEFIERDNIVKAAQIQENAPWGLARLSSSDPKSSYYSFDGTGQGVTVYVVDSGLSFTKGKYFLFKLNINI